MPRVKRKRKRRNDYTPAERQQLLTGMVMHHLSTRFGGPAFRSPINVEAVRQAWAIIGDELTEDFQSAEFDKYRERFNGEPWAVRLLAGLESAAPSTKRPEAAR